MAAVACPACRAMNEEGPGCRRCKADLALVFALEADRAALLSEARQALEEGWARQGLALAERANGLRRGEDARRVAACCALLAGEWRQALRWANGTG